MTPIAALVVTYDHAGEIAACLDALLAQEPDEVVVVDNASRDDTVAVLRGYGDRIRLIEQATNTGYADGVNAAFAAVRAGADVLLLNPDAVLASGCLDALRRHLAACPRAAAAAALLHDADGGLQRFARRDVGLREVLWNFTEVGRRLDVKRGNPALRERIYEDAWGRGIDAPLAVDCPAAACVLLRGELLGAPLLEPELKLFFNDAELFRRLRRAGHTLDVVPDAHAEHGYGTSIQRADKARMRAEWVVALRRYLAPELGPLGRAALQALLLADAVSAAALLAIGKGKPGTREHVRGTLGGLGLPGGAQPWLTPARRRRRGGGDSRPAPASADPRSAR